MKREVVSQLYIDLPWPPSLNSYYRTVNGRPIISAEGRKYRARVISEALRHKVGTVAGRCGVLILVYPPDNRARDLDNLLKCLLDALTKAGCYEDDSRIDWLKIERHAVVDGGMISVVVTNDRHERNERAAVPMWKIGQYPLIT
jgi:crossover junction endodeoxyribonuclease RusA